MRGILLLVVVVTGCDGLFNIDHVDFVPPTADAAPMIDAVPDAFVTPELLARFEFENDLKSTTGGTAICAPTPGSCPQYVVGKHGNAVRIGGSAPCIKYTLPHPIQSFTVMAWIDRGTDDTASRAIFAQQLGAGSSDSWLLNTDSNHDVRFITNNGNFDDTMVTPGALAQTWQHVAISFNFATATKRFYADGMVKNTSSGAQIQWAGLDVTIGCDRDITNYVSFFLGNIDDFRIYDRALADAEIAAIALGAD